MKCRQNRSLSAPSLLVKAARYCCTRLFQSNRVHNCVPDNREFLKLHDRPDIQTAGLAFLFISEVPAEVWENSVLPVGYAIMTIKRTQKRDQQTPWYLQESSVNTLHTAAEENATGNCLIQLADIKVISIVCTTMLTKWHLDKSYILLQAGEKLNPFLFLTLVHLEQFLSLNLSWMWRLHSPSLSTSLCF